jgi:hypothetical protein
MASGATGLGPNLVDRSGLDMKGQEFDSGLSSNPKAAAAASSVFESVGGGGAGPGKGSPVPPTSFSWSQYCPDMNTLKTLPSRVWAVVSAVFTAIWAKLFGAPAAAAAASASLQRAEPVLSAERKAARTQVLTELHTSFKRKLWSSRTVDPWMSGTASYSMKANFLMPSKHADLVVTGADVDRCLHRFFANLSLRLDSFDHIHFSQTPRHIDITYEAKGDLIRSDGQGIRQDSLVGATEGHDIP